MHHIASITGWGFREIMEELPLSAGLQIIDAELYANDIQRVYVRNKPSFDSLALIDEAIKKLHPR